ncbi:YhgE/Pip domain-containing protein [Agromyces sp. H3Y2-19a]|uniref:YhgE/Pip domain-containing protein n=1 Tax=Agromyces TaxID=33877 RepID=UPI0023B98FD1|nr:YhgE/Pip domain-containing protein [Agromyces chromiiresistens]MDF0512106.1 YhgE/Pip domain-containing protein [Agromyces chromiiresistens]
MKIPQMIAAEFRRLTSTKMSVLALLALIAVPVLYGGLYLWANQDPYAKFAEVPVALVVEDEGVAASTSATGEATEARNVGEEIADELIADGAFDWQRVSAEEAATGLDESRYDFAITFPADFSDALASVQTDAPRQAEIVLSTNDANSYLAGTIGKQAVEKIRTTIAEKVGDEAASTLLDSISTIRGKLVDAADGASQLTDGAGRAVDGAAQLATGATQLADGNAQLATGSAQLETGTQQLADGTARLADGSATLADGAAQVADGNAQLAASADRVGTAVADAAAAVPQARADIEAALEAQGLDQATIDTVLAKLDAVGDRITTGNEKVQSVVGDIDRLADGSAQVAAGSADLAAGASTAADGAARAASGASQLADGAARAATGSAQLRDGVGTLQSGLGELADGAGQLRDGLDAGVDQIPDSSQSTRDAQAATIADPITLETSSMAQAGNYGAGLAPFFAALAGWIGIYALFLIVKPISRRAVTALHSPIRITLAGWLTPGLLGAVQMAALYLVLAFTLGFQMHHPLGVVGTMVFASVTYAAIILALNVWLGSVGQFLGLVLMVLQLVTAGGTFPWQTLPAPLAALHHVLPMGYVVDAMRQFMYGGDLSRAAGDFGVLAIWLVGALVVSAIGVTRMTHFRTLRDLQPSLIG